MKNSNQPNEGGTDFKGLEDFIVDVNTDGYENPTHNADDVQIDLGEGNNGEEENTDNTDNQDNQDEIKKEESSQGDDPKEEKKEETPKTNQPDNYYKIMASKMLEKGKWSDAELELEEGKTVKLSELEDMDEETFFAIAESQDKFKDDEIKNNYIKKGDFDENKLKVIEILKEGGDIKDIFETPEEAVRPFEGADLEDEKVQQSIFYQYLTQVQKHDAEDAKVLVANHKKRDALGDKVKEIVSGYQKQYDDKLTSKLEAIKEENKARAAKDKELSKSLQEIYQAYNLDEKVSKKLASLGTKRNESGDFELDAIYADKLEKPEEAAELIWFLTDKEGYMKSKMSETKVNTEKKHLKTIKLIRDNKRNGESAGVSNDGKSDFIIDVNQEFNN